MQRKKRRKHNMIKPINGALKTVLINYNILEPIDNFVPITAGKAIAWNAAGKAVKTVVDGN